MSINHMQLRWKITPRALIICLVVAAALATSGYAKLSLVFTEASGSLFWDADEAYLFLDYANSGVRMSYLSYLLEFPKTMLGGPTLRSDLSGSVLALRISRQAIEPLTTQDLSLGDYRFVKGDIYSRSGIDGSIWKWSGTAFIRASGDEDRAFNPVAPGGFLGFDNVNGWSERAQLGGGVRDGYEVPFTLGGEKFSLVTRQGALGEVSIDLIRPGQAPQKIWSLDQSTRWVSKAHYQRIFHK